MLLPLTLLLAAGGDAGQPVAQALMISVDGLRSDALLAARGEELPGFQILLAGAGTLDARCDPWHPVTLPNHLDMVTGRLVEGEAGHGWKENVLPPAAAVLHGDGGYVAGVFDVAHDHGLRTGIFAAKEKFVLMDRSWDAEHGAPDAVPPDDGRDKVDTFRFEPRAAALTDSVLEFLQDPASEHCLLLLHYGDPDFAGHHDGWDLTPGSPYMQSVARVDGQLLRILTWARSRPPGTVAILLTSDHGGGAPMRQHWGRQYWVNRIIPFLVWRNDGRAAGDLYVLNPGRRAHAGLAPAPLASPPPVRNAEAGNVALALLGLPAIPGSTEGRRQDLRLTENRH